MCVCVRGGSERGRGGRERERRRGRHETGGDRPVTACNRAKLAGTRWTPTDVVHFKQRADCLKIFYSDYTVDGKNVDGDLTLAENIADNGGVKIAFEAFQQVMAGLAWCHAGSGLV